MNRKISFHSEHERATLYSQHSQNNDFGYKPLLKDLFLGLLSGLLIVVFINLLAIAFH